MQTFTGRQFWPLEPDPGDVCIEDIAHHLSMICRFGGASWRFYSVAEHSVLVSYKAGLNGLLHDAAEAYIGDMIRPLKRSVPVWEWYHPVEDRIMDVIYEALGLETPGAPELNRIHVADDRVLATERLSLHHPGHRWLLPEPYADIKIKKWGPQRAEKEFLALCSAYGLR